MNARSFLYTMCCHIITVFLFVAGCLFALPTEAQIAERVYKSDYHIVPEKKGQLFVEVDNLSFFKNNEFAGGITEGYSLPGLWVQPKAVYYPLENIKLEAGIHSLIYWGASRYPSAAYQDIAQWKGNQYQTGVHILPYFRAQVALSDHVDIILGDIYGGANHNLIEPLYNPELNLTADPEVGLQLLYASRVFDLDAWVNWQSFIFRNDSHQEAFTFGLSTRLKFNDPASRFHFYMPIQGMAQHRGGEIDTIYTNSVQTLMNGAAGVGAVWNVGQTVVKRVCLEFDAAAYYQQAGAIWPFINGHGWYAHASVDIKDFRIKTSFWDCHNFNSMFGNPFFGAMSLKTEGATFDRPQMVYLGAEYSRSFGKYYSIGIEADVYQHLLKTMNLPDGESRKMGSATSFSAGVYLRINPAFLIKQF